MRLRVVAELPELIIPRNERTRVRSLEARS